MDAPRLTGGTGRASPRGPAAVSGSVGPRPRRRLRVCRAAAPPSSPGLSDRGPAVVSRSEPSAGPCGPGPLKGPPRGVFAVSPTDLGSEAPSEINFGPGWGRVSRAGRSLRLVCPHGRPSAARFPQAPGQIGGRRAPGTGLSTPAARSPVRRAGRVGHGGFRRTLRRKVRAGAGGPARRRSGDCGFPSFSFIFGVIIFGVIICFSFSAVNNAPRDTMRGCSVAAVREFPVSLMAAGSFVTARAQ